MRQFFTRSSETEKRKKLRNELSRAEAVLWREIRGEKLAGYKFRRQHSVGPFVMDFYCPERKLAVEVDGDSHFLEGKELYDKEREEYINSFGIKILRFTNSEVFKSLESVVEKIRELFRTPPPTPPR